MYGQSMPSTTASAMCALARLPGSQFESLVEIISDLSNQPQLLKEGFPTLLQAANQARLSTAENSGQPLAPDSTARRVRRAPVTSAAAPSSPPADSPLAGLFGVPGAQAQPSAPSTAQPYAATRAAGGAQAAAAPTNSPSGGGTLRVASESMDLLKLISRDFVLLAGKGLTCAYHIMSGDMISKDGFALFCDEHYGTVELVNADGSKDRKKAGDVWWQYQLPGKRTVRRIVMEPTSRSEDLDPCGPQVFNRWHLLKLSMAEPNLQATPADCEILLKHLMYLADGDQAAVSFFLNWLAQLYQTPEIKMPTAVLLYSKFGRVGKTLLHRLLAAVFGAPMVANLNGSTLGKQFMDALEHKRVVFFNEVARSDKVDGYERFKNMISEETVSFEGKGRAEKEVRNFLHFIITTNNPDALPLMEDDGRVLVMRTEERPKSPDYYKALVDWMDGPGPGLLAGLLANWEFAVGWDPHAPVPQTDAGRQMQHEARGELCNWIDDLVQSSQPPFDKDLLKTGAIIEQLSVLYPHQSRQCRMNTTTVGKALRILGFAQISSGTANKYLCLPGRQDYWVGKGPTSWRAYFESHVVPEDYPFAQPQNFTRSPLTATQPTRH